MPFQEEHKRKEKNSSSSLSVEDKDKGIHARSKGCFGKKTHSSKKNLCWNCKKIGFFWTHNLFFKLRRRVFIFLNGWRNWGKLEKYYEVFVCVRCKTKEFIGNRKREANKLIKCWPIKASLGFGQVQMAFWVFVANFHIIHE